VGYVAQGRAPGFFNPSLDAFQQGLRETGYVEGQNLAIEWRFADGEPERLAALLADLVARPVDILVVEGMPAAHAAHAATTTIPIVMTGGDPVGSGLAASLARPGGNVTGLSEISTPLDTKRLELLVRSVPGAARIGVLWNTTVPVKAIGFHELQSVAPVLGVELVSLPIAGPADVDGTLATAAASRLDGLVVLQELVVNRRLLDIAAFVERARLPAIYYGRFPVDQGGLMGYGISFDANRRRAAYYVDRILKGANPAELPIEQPMTFDFVVNMRTARALGITFPPEVLLQVTETID
jgi:putative ABC transport system substrate-binding protein